jgi:hypothetical protein
MSATGLQLNWENTEFAGNSYTHVTQVTFAQGGKLIPFMGDANKMPVVIALQSMTPTASITSSDVASLMAIQPGAGGTITTTQVDALNATGGAINWTLINAVHEDSQNSGSWGNFAVATATFQAYSSDGLTPPLSFTRS